MTHRPPSLPWPRIVFLLLVVNFVAFIAVTGLLGGDALNGRVEEGRYYLSRGRAETETNAWIWWFSLLYAALTFGSFLLYAAVMAWRHFART